MILKEVTWCDTNLSELIRRIRLSARGLKRGVLRPAPSRGTEQDNAASSGSGSAKNKEN